MEQTHVFIGPYAEVKVNLVTEGKTLLEQPSVDWYDLTDGALAPAHSRGKPPNERIGGSEILFRRYRFFPNVTRPGEPERQMVLAEPWVEDWLDWSNLDIKAETVWFAKVFSTEIALLKEAYGAVEVKWGYLQWCG